MLRKIAIFAARARRRPTAVAALVLYLCAGCAAWAQATATADATALLISHAEILAQDEMKKQNIAGLTMTIVVNKMIVASRAYGWADLENHASTAPTTLFRTASIAKSMTASAAMALYQAGKLDLDAPVQKYCPAFPQKPWPITTRELLGHLSGIRHYRADESDVFSTKHYIKISDAFEMFANDPLLFPPGTKMQYTTYGFDVVGCVIEGASGKDFMTTLNQLVLTPSAMTSTRTDDAFTIIDGRSRPYTLDKQHRLENAAFVDTSNKIPGGGLLSTSDDLARFAIALESNKFLDAKTTTLMWTSQKTSDGKETNYGYGFGLKTIDGVPCVGHTGGQPGASSVLLMVPSRGFAVAIMANTDEIKVRPIAETLASEFLKSSTQTSSTSQTSAGATQNSGNAAQSAGGQPVWRLGDVVVLTDTHGVDIGPYLGRLLDRIRQNWYALIPQEARVPNLLSGTTTIQFNILQDGKFVAMKLASSSGNTNLDRAAWGGITASYPFAPLPGDFKGGSLGLRITFRYNPPKTAASAPPPTPAPPQPQPLAH